VFSRRLLLERATAVTDGGGGWSETWAEVGAIWAAVRMRSGSMRDTEFGETPRLRLRITTPEVPEGHPVRVRRGDRLRDGLRVYGVSAVHEGEGRTLVVLAAEEVSA
jgi:head-tail adaptor